MTKVLYMMVLAIVFVNVASAQKRTDELLLPEPLKEFSTSGCDYLGGNIPQNECCRKCHPRLSLNPMPGHAPLNSTVTIGVTAWDFGTPDAIQSSGMNIDLGNKTFLNLAFTNGVVQLKQTQYDTAGDYRIRADAWMQHYFKANDWWCVYKCTCTAESTIRVGQNPTAEATKWDSSPERKKFRDRKPAEKPKNQ